MYNFESIDLQTCFYMCVTYYFVVTCLLGVVSPVLLVYQSFLQILLDFKFNHERPVCSLTVFPDCWVVGFACMCSTQLLDPKYCEND